jgi:hypothetical protein
MSNKSGKNFFRDFLMGGTIGAISKTVMSPVERVKILMQTMDSNPKVISGEVKPYSGIMDCFRRVSSEQGVPAGGVRCADRMLRRFVCSSGRYFCSTFKYEMRP